MQPSNKYSNMTDIVVMETSLGTIEIALDREKAPITVENFVNYVNNGFFDGLCFHRVIRRFMIQGGGFTTDGTSKDTGDPIKIESRNGLKRARAVDNDNLDYPSFDGHGYTVFGKVVSGMDAVKEIEGVATGTKLTPYGPMQDWPNETVEITKAYLKK